MANTSEFSGVLGNLTAGTTGQATIDQFNQERRNIETQLNRLASRISDLNSKNALIRKNVPLSPTARKGCLVYFDAENAEFAPAKAMLLGEPGSNGESVEAPCARVEGLIIDDDSSPGNSTNVTGTLLYGGYWQESNDPGSGYSVIQRCLGADPQLGTYYLSAVTAGCASKMPGGPLRQPVLTYYGSGSIGLGIYCMAHDNHFHGSCTLDANCWMLASDPPADLPPGASIPTGARYWYNAATDGGMINMGELTERTAAVFLNGVLQSEADGFVVRHGYLWYAGNSIPASGSVRVFNSYPWAYDSPVVRGISCPNDTITVRNRNGLVQLTAHELVSGSLVTSAYAVATVVGKRLMMTPVVSDLYAGPGISIRKLTNGGAIVTATASIAGSPMDAYTIHHLQTNQTCDGRFTYITFPANRTSAIVATYPVNGIPSTTQLLARVWCDGVGAGASFNVKMSWIPEASAGQTASLPTSSQAVSTTLSVASGNATTVVHATSADGIAISGSGTLTARIELETPQAQDVRLLRVGFIADVLNAAAAAPTNDETEMNSVSQMTYSVAAATRIPAFACIKAGGDGARPCGGSVAEDCNKCIGVSVNAATQGSDVQFVSQGIIQSSGFNFTPGAAVFIGANGSLVQGDPQSAQLGLAFIQRVGTALTAGVVLINIEPGVQI